MKRVIVILLVVLLLSACGQQPTLEDAESSIADYEEQIEQLTKKVELRDDRIEELATTLKYREEEIETFSADMDELMNSDNSAVYSKGYSELQQNSLPRAMRVKEPVYLRVHPYDEAAAVRGTNRPPFRLNGQDVIILNCVRNEDNEIWVLVEYPDLTSYACNYGYVPLKHLVEMEYSIDLLDQTEAIADIRIGDPIEEAILVWGDDYTVHRGPNKMAYTFGSGPDVIIDVDTVKNSIMRVTVNMRGFDTEEGIQVGNSAEEVLGIYGAKYERNIDGKLYEERSEYIFKLNEEGYVIEFVLDDNLPYENISDWNFIAGISIYNIYEGDW